MKLKIIDVDAERNKKVRAIRYLILWLVLCFGFTIGVNAYGDTSIMVSVRFNNDNLMTTPQPAPIGGGWDFGTMSIIPLNEGKTLIVERYLLEPEYGISIWKYSMDDAYWYVTNRGIIYGENGVGLEPMASSSLQALSIYLTL